MRFRGLIVAVLVLLALGGVLYWSNHHKPAATAATPSANPSPAILKIDSSAVSQVTLARKGASPLTLEKEQGDLWRITAPQPFLADQDSVSGLVTALANLNADRVVEEKASDLRPYGLVEPSLTVDIIAKDHKEHQLLLGDDTPAGGDVYAMLADDPRIFTIANYNKTSLDKGLNDLRDRRLVTLVPDKVSRATIEKNGQTIEFARTKDGWQILKPSPLRADAFAVDDFVSSVTGARMDLSGNGHDDVAAEFAKAAPLATVSLTGDQGSETLEVRKEKDDYLARSSVADGAYKVDSSLGAALGKSLDDFRNKKLFDFGYEQPSKIELHAGTKAWYLTRSGDDWWSNGKKMDASSVDSLIDEFRGLTASSFPSAGFSNPEVEATVTSNDGKLVETVQIAKSGIAKRDDGPSLYQLDSSVVTDLMNAANALKPAAPVAK
jgi:hypothetical protein